LPGSAAGTEAPAYSTVPAISTHAAEDVG
jgi:hypothetical protein